MKLVTYRIDADELLERLLPSPTPPTPFVCSATYTPCRSSPLLRREEEEEEKFPSGVQQEEQEEQLCIL